MSAGQADTALSKSHDDQNQRAPAVGKKAKGKKTLDSSEASRLLQARISQLEQDAAGEKDQELEIEREVKKANRDLLQQVAKLDDMQKIEFLMKRSSELLADMRRLEKETQKNRKQREALQRDRDTSRIELGKAINVKDKLEKLCRELQRDNNKLKNENKEFNSTTSRNASAWDEKFAALLSTLERYQEEKDTPRKQVVDMEMDELFRVRFKSFIEQFELRELHFHSSMRVKELEVQYHQARYEREKKNVEVEAGRTRSLQDQVQAFTKTETELRNQLNVYVDKFKQVEDTLNNSNDLFLSFRKEMEDMSKKGKRLEKENELHKRNKEATTMQLLRLAGERDRYRKEVAVDEKKIDKLKSIIQQMQHQGRKAPAGMSSVMGSTSSDSHGGAEGDDESDYSNDEDDVPSEFDDDDKNDDDDDTEEELQPATKQAAPVTYGPERPPPVAGPPANATLHTANGR